jgi:hypothetical protein
VALGGGLALLQLVALGWAALGDPVPTPIRVSLQAPADCSTSEDFFQSLRARSDRVRPANPGERSVEIGVRLVRTGSKVHGELRITGEHGESDKRQVDGASCAEVVEALSLTVALSLVPTSPVAPSEPDAPAAPATPAESGDPSEAPPETDSDPDPDSVPGPELDGALGTGPRAFEVALSAHAMIAGFVAPDVQMGGGAALRFTLGSASGSAVAFTLGGFHLQNDLFATPQRVRFRLTAAEVGICPTRFALFAGGSLEPCLSGVGGSLRAEGVGFDRTETASRAYWGLGGTVTARFPLSPERGFGFEGGIGITIPLVERRFVASNPDRRLGETPRISALGRLGGFWAF